MKHFPTFIAVAFATVLGAAAHEYAWPHYTLLLGDGGRIQNVRMVPFDGSIVHVEKNAKDVEVSDSSFVGAPHMSAAYFQ